MVARLSIANAPIASCSSRTRVVRRDRCVECAAARCAVVVVVVVVVVVAFPRVAPRSVVLCARDHHHYRVMRSIGRDPPCDRACVCVCM